ncbi:MAG: pyridoxamine 5'-phosphate oxidase family protein [Chloroflexota bacterium]
MHKDLSREQAMAILERAEVGHLATCNADEPYVVPLNFVYFGERIYFHCSPQGRKLANITANPRVCFQVESEWRLIPQARACSFTAHYYSVMVSGTARAVGDPERRLAALRALVAKYDPKGLAPVLTQEDLEKRPLVIVEITPETVGGVDHARLPAPS